ncbi:MAG: SusD/RagB family nutrient-binding outer membrane lipoprotein [Mangrovibacterium sp.]
MKINIKNTVATFALAATSVACTGDFEDINTNPNTSTVGAVKAHTLFEPVLYGSANEWQENTWFWNNELIQFTAFTGGGTRQEHMYYISDQNWQSIWNGYAGLANNASHMYDLSVEQDNLPFQAISQTMKVLLLSNLTDMFGDIPYSEAFLGREGGTTKPKYDSQQAVYEQMFAELEAANTVYASNPIMESDKRSLDGLFGGDMAKWQKFNNSIYLRLLCRVSGRSEMNAGTKMAEMLANPETYPIFTSNEDNAALFYKGVDPYDNYFTEHTLSSFTSGGRKLTEQFINMTLIADTINEERVEQYCDPRLPIWGQKAANSVYWKGTVAGCTAEERSTVNYGTSQLNYAVFCRSEAPTFFMDYAEVQFIFAEAALKGYISGNEEVARSYYENAITASVEKWADLGQYGDTIVAVASEDISLFLASELASWDLNEDHEKLIAEQKHLALFWTSMEAYHEYRRTGYPELTIGAGTLNDHILPTRFAYPNVSVATNSANVQEALNRMNGSNDMKTPLWWSKQAIEE